MLKRIYKHGEELYQGFWGSLCIILVKEIEGKFFYRKNIAFITFISS